jgi:hypothetical protein
LGVAEGRGDADDFGFVVGLALLTGLAEPEGEGAADGDGEAEGVGWTSASVLV